MEKLTYAVAEGSKPDMRAMGDMGTKNHSSTPGKFKAGDKEYYGCIIELAPDALSNLGDVMAHYYDRKIANGMATEVEAGLLYYPSDKTYGAFFVLEPNKKFGIVVTKTEEAARYIKNNYVA
jgi:hypothetical protein